MPNAQDPKSQISLMALLRPETERGAALVYSLLATIGLVCAYFIYLIIATTANPAELSVDRFGGNEWKDVFEYGLERYRADCSALTTNLYLQATFLGVALLALVTHKQHWEFGQLGLEVSVRWLRAFLPIALTYLWLDLGFILHTCVMDRLRLVSLLNSIDSAEAKWLLTTLDDRGLIDLWMLAFHETAAYIREKGTVLNRALLVLYILFFACSHATICALVAKSAARYRDRAGLLVGHVAYLLFLLGIIVLSHVAFAIDGGHKTWLQHCLLISAAGISLVLAFINDRYYGHNTEAR